MNIKKMSSKKNEIPETGEKWKQIEIARDMTIETLRMVGIGGRVEQGLADSIETLVGLAYAGGQLDAQEKVANLLETKLKGFKGFGGLDESIF